MTAVSNFLRHSSLCLMCWERMRARKPSQRSVFASNPKRNAWSKLNHKCLQGLPARERLHLKFDPLWKTFGQLWSSVKWSRYGSYSSLIRPEIFDFDLEFFVSTKESRWIFEVEMIFNRSITSTQCSLSIHFSTDTSSSKLGLEIKSAQLRQ